MHTQVAATMMGFVSRLLMDEKTIVSTSMYV